MSNEYVLIQAKGDGLGQIAVSNNVINHIVMITVNESKYVFFDDGNVKKSLSIKNTGTSLVVDLKVRVQYGKDVDRVCKKLQEELQRSIELMVDYKSTEVNLNVVGFKFN